MMATRPSRTRRVRLPGSLVVRRRGAILTVRLARPHKHNALDEPTVVGLHDLFESLPPAVKAVVIHAEGPSFCAGLDLTELTERSVIEGFAHSRLWHWAFEPIQFSPAPVIAVLHGAVIGGGLELACAAHLRVAERSAFYGLPEGQRGIFVGGGGSVRLPRLIGTAQMTDMMLTGRRLTAHEGQALGLTQYLVEDGAGLAKGLDLARCVAANAAMTNFAVIHALPYIADMPAASGYLTEALVAGIAQGNREAKDRLKSFIAKNRKTKTAARRPKKKA